MFKFKIIAKILFLLPVLLLALLVDGILFALANSCTACSSFGQYLTSNFSLFNSLIVSLTALIALLVRKK